MRNECVQMSLEDIYNTDLTSMEDKKPAPIEFLENHIDFEPIISTTFLNFKTFTSAYSFISILR